MKSKKGEAGRKNGGTVDRKSMSYDYVLALVEECHRFEEKAYTRVSLEELAEELIPYLKKMGFNYI